MRSEKTRMLAGELYYSNDPELTQFNHVLPYTADKERLAVLRNLLGSIDEEQPPFIEPPLFVDYGRFTHVGRGFYANAGCCILDCAQLLPPGHALDPVLRNGRDGAEFALPITIKDGVWIGGGAIILGGVTLGANCVVGAGAVVTKDVSPYTVVAGNPAKIVRVIAPGEGVIEGRGRVPPRTSPHVS